MEEKSIKIQKALLPAGAGIIAIGALAKLLFIAVIGAVLVIFGAKTWRQHHNSKNEPPNED